MNMGLWRAMLAREPSAVVRLMEEMAGCTMNLRSCSKAALPSSHSTSKERERRGPVSRSLSPRTQERAAYGANRRAILHMEGCDWLKNRKCSTDESYET